MEHLKNIKNELDSSAEAFPEYVNLCKKYKIPHGILLGSVVGILSLLAIIF